MEAVMKKLVALGMLLVSAWLAGCNTMEGLGRDVERGGEKLQGEARENRR
jgi:entericidin B